MLVLLSLAIVIDKLSTNHITIYILYNYCLPHLGAYALYIYIYIYGINHIIQLYIWNSWSLRTGQQPVQTGLILYNILSSMVGVRLTNVWFHAKKPLPFIIWWLVGFPAKKTAIHELMNGRVSWEKAHHSPIYKLRLVNKCPKDAEDINKVTYQKTGPDWSRPVLEFLKWQRTADQTAIAVLCSPVISGPGWSESSPSLFPVLGPDFQTLL